MANVDVGSIESLVQQVNGIHKEFIIQLGRIKQQAALAGEGGATFLARTSLFDGPFPEGLQPKQISEGAKVYAHRRAMLESVVSRLPEYPVCCEIGVLEGGFSDQIIRLLKPSIFHLFDVSFAKLRPNVRDAVEVVLHEGDSGRLVHALENCSLDFAYIDGDHSHAGVKRDLAAIYSKLKPGAYIQVNDYTPWSVLSGIPYGIIGNVNRWLADEKCILEGFALHQFGHNDVLLRRL